MRFAIDESRATDVSAGVEAMPRARDTLGPVRVVTWVLAAMLGCAEPTETLVIVDAEPLSAARADALRVIVRDSSGAPKLDRRLRLGVEVAFPTTVPVAPLDGDASRTFELEATLHDSADIVFALQSLRSTFVAGRSVVEHLLFDDLCFEMTTCDSPLTCRRGMCVDSFRDPNAPEPALPPILCLGAECWENPRPTGAFLQDVCIFHDDDLIIGATGAVLVREGGEWRREGPPDIATIEHVACWDDGRAIGLTSSSGESSRPWERTSEGVWRQIDFAPPVELTDVAGESADDVWFVGRGGRVFRRVGGEVGELALGLTGDLEGVSVGGGRVFVAGQGAFGTIADGAYVPVDPPPGASGDFGEVAASGERYAVIAIAGEGAFVAVNEASAWTALDVGRRIEHVALDDDGSAVAAAGSYLYRRAPGANAFDEAGETNATTVRGVALRRGHGYAVGNEGLFYRLEGDGFRDQRAFATAVDLTAVASNHPEGERVIAVGSRGLVLARDANGEWEASLAAVVGAPFPPPDLRDVWVGPSLAVAVGDGGVVAESEGGAWTASTPVATDLRAVSGSGDRVVAAGGDTAIERTSGGWSALAAFPAGLDATAVAFDARGALYAGSADGRLLRLDATWTELASGLGPVVRLRLSAGSLYVIATDVRRWTGSELEPGIAGPETPLDVVANDAGPQYVLTATWLHGRGDGAFDDITTGGSGLVLAPAGPTVVGRFGRIYHRGM